MNGKKLYRNMSNNKLAGVCSGIADYIDFDVTIIRLIWAGLTLCTGFFPGIVLYIIAMIIVPTNDSGNGDGNINGNCKEI
ncbi:MAG: PspC domain-containing protein [Clostridia bacterium]|jgi:phage shock protein PspC (stress-responsive transcriptional regulator)|nr:PspC domain-containing protein [Clostridia bacterium]